MASVLRKVASYYEGVQQPRGSGPKHQSMKSFLDAGQEKYKILDFYDLEEFLTCIQLSVIGGNKGVGYNKLL